MLTEPAQGEETMRLMFVFDIIQVVALVGILFVGFQLRDRLDRIGNLLDKK
jgi:hypothetical protein